MTFYEGFAWQEQNQKARDERDEEIRKIMRDNPWLTRDDAAEWQAQQAEARRVAPRPCCPCHGRPPGIVRKHNYVGSLGTGKLMQCDCGCHEGAEYPAQEETADQPQEDAQVKQRRGRRG